MLIVWYIHAISGACSMFATYLDKSLSHQLAYIDKQHIHHQIVRAFISYQYEFVFFFLNLQFHSLANEMNGLILVRMDIHIKSQLE